MRRQRTGLVLGITFLVMLLLAGSYGYKIYMDYRVPVPYTGRIMSVPIVENLDFLEGRQKRTSEHNPGVFFEQTLLPYSADGTLYLSQDFAVEKWMGELTTGSQDSFLCTLPDAAWEDKAGSIRDNHIFKLWLVEEDCYYELALAVCGMPVMTLSTQRSEKQDLGDYETDPDRFYYDPDTLYYGQIQVFNPGLGVPQYEIMESGVRYYLRGAGSANFKKKSYSISLLDAKGEKLDAALLGMRSDNSWKLKAMVLDTEKINEKTACQLWEEFARTNTEVNESGPHMEYLELIVDNEYMGLYGLVEPVDSKKLGLDKRDVLYKFTNWMVPEDEDFDYAIEHRWKIMTFIRVRYPDPIEDYQKAWGPVRDYLNTFYRGAGDGRAAETKLYLSNAIDMLLFNMAVSGSDNHYKNLYFVADVDDTGNYVMRQIPWDLDLTFGTIPGKSFKDDVTVVYEEAAVPFLRDTQPELVREPLRERWLQCRETFLSTEHILDVMETNRDYLLNAGVMERENTRWPSYQMSLDITARLDYQERRMAWLDEYFENF